MTYLESSLKRLVSVEIFRSILQLGKQLWLLKETAFAPKRGGQ